MPFAWIALALGFLEFLFTATPGARATTPADLPWVPAGAIFEANAATGRSGRGVYKDGSADVVFSVISGDRERVTNEPHVSFDGAR